MGAPERNLFCQIGESQEGTYDPGAPTHKWHKSAREGHRPLGVANLCGGASDAALCISKLHRIDVTNDDFVAITESHRCTAGRRDAKHAAPAAKRLSLDFRVFVHVPEQQAVRATGRAQASRMPLCLQTHDHLPGIAPHAQASTRKAMFFTIMPAGSGMMSRDQSNPLTLRTTSNATSAVAQAPG